MEGTRVIAPYRASRSLTCGAWAWIVQRITSIALLVLVPLKILSGYAAVGKIGSPGLAALHGHVGLDFVIMAALTCHAFYGLRVILIEHGMASKASWLFHVFTGASAVVLGAWLWLVW